MYPKTLYPKTKQILDSLKSTSLLDSFYLAGGTGLSLQIGHRKSADLDFFTKKFPKKDILLQELVQLSPKVIQEAPGTLDIIISDVKVSFLEYSYPLLQNLVEFGKVKLASIIDIACMKLSAISSRGTKKDFIDLYVILQKHSLIELFESFEKKFKGVSYQKLHILKSLTYFDDADKDPDPDYIEKIDWDKAKRKISRKVKEYLS